MLLKAGANGRSICDGETALHRAAEENDLNTVKVLAERWPVSRDGWRMFLMGVRNNLFIKNHKIIYELTPLNDPIYTPLTPPNNL